MYTFCDNKKNQAIDDRNRFWEDSDEIPSWVDLTTVDLDQFFTKPEIAEYCHASLLSKMEEHGAKESGYKFIEPSVGGGAFYNLLPKNRRVGIDIMPLIPNVIEHDFLSWMIKPNGYNYAVIGNPPFGYRAWLALAFINHAAKFSEYVGMILPMSFQSDGKGSPKHRVKGLELLHTEILPKDSFIDPHGKQMKINAIWQIWKKGENKKVEEKQCTQWLELFTVDERKERLCGQNRLHEAGFFLQRTYYHEPPTLVKSFKDVKYVCGYGLVFKKDKDKIVKLLQNTDWNKYSNLAAHNCRHISMYHINRVLTEAGYINE